MIIAKAINQEVVDNGYIRITGDNLDYDFSYNINLALIVSAQ